MQLELSEVSKHKLPEAAKSLLGYLVSRPPIQETTGCKRLRFSAGWFFGDLVLEEPLFLLDCTGKSEGGGCLIVSA